MMVRNAWYVAAWADEVGQQPLARRICDQPIVLYRDPAGRVAALEDRCCHRGTPLSRGQVVENGLQCGYHGLVFDAAGACVEVPGQNLVPPNARVRSYPTVEKDGFVWIWPGDAARADAAQIIDYPYHNDTGRWPHKHATYHIAASATLMVDNLMDLTHLGYVHARTVGGNPKTHVDAQMKTTRTPRGLRFIRWMRNSVPPPTYVRAVGFKGRVDRWQEFEFVAPGNVLQATGALDAGSGRDAEDRDGPFAIRLYHGLTPETQGSCFYFWSVANGYRQGEAEATEQLFQEIAATFDEDKTIVEAQQARLTELGEAGLVDIVSDGNRVLMRRAVERLLAEESRTRAAE
jgi:phenylpropionate dioxygenase-like ring-hydroxylating dioxygenase large terminal subunit